MTKRNRKARTGPRLELVLPTGERMARAGTDWVRGDTGTITMRDAPLERLEGRGVLTQQQYTAGDKYRHHVHRAGLMAHYSAVRMDGVFGGEGVRGLPASESAIHHREQVRKAEDALGPRLSMVVNGICAVEIDPVMVGRKLGWGTENQGRAVATELLKEGLDRLCKLWGVT